jgi:hypothetical protein
LCLSANCFAETTSVVALIIGWDSRGWVLQVNAGKVRVAETKETRYWANFASGTRQSFSEGQNIRVKLTESGGQFKLREMADEATATWLDSLKQDVWVGRVVGGDIKSILVRFANLTEIKYKVSDKTKVIFGKNSVRTTDLRAGQLIFVKGKSSGYDILASEISDQPIEFTLPKSQEAMTISGLATEFDLERNAVVIEHPTRPKLSIFIESTSKIWFNGARVALEKIPTGSAILFRIKRERSGLLTASEVYAISRP